MNASEAFKSRHMKSMLGDHLLRNGLSKISYDQSRKTSTVKLLPGPSTGQVDKSLITTKQRKVESVFTTMNKLVKGKLSLVGGVDKLFRRIFSLREGERLLRASRCSLYTTAGPIAGRLFISTEKLAFCSDRPIAKVSSPTGEPLRFHYKIVIPLMKIGKWDPSEDMKKPSQKYLQVVTADEFEFWFMGFVNYNKTLKCLQQAVSQSYIYRNTTD
ncbi:GEM-like protein 4 [Chenopodium quinoa]|uniref:GRAM domain-containing protein n=1 Tax=Chenopodium quinoa TaxID=63459 RepID=A0A803LS07_CHEQI|nr:GEM-like protein 4 [Chenopodium quinoa]